MCILTKNKIKIIILIFLILTILSISARAYLINGELREMSSDEFWDLKDGYRLGVAIEGDNVVFTVSKNGQELKNESIKLGPSASFFYYRGGSQIISIPTMIRLEYNKVQLRLYQQSDDGIPLPATTSAPTPTPTSELSKYISNLTSTPSQTTKPRITGSKPTAMPTPTTTLIIPKPPPMDKSYRLPALILIILLLFQYILKFRK